MNKKQIVFQEINNLQNIRINEELRVKQAIASARKIPEFLKLDNEARKIQLEISKFDEASPKLPPLHEKLQKLENAKRKVLKANNIDENLLITHYNCEKCKDTGFIDETMCDCLTKNVQNALIKQSGINNKLNFSFKDCSQELLLNNELLAKAYKVAHIYCDNFPKNKHNNLLFFGAVGTGKTFLLECIANELTAKMNYVVFSTAYDISKTMMHAYSTNYDERTTLLSPLFESDLLIIDDLGTEPLFHESVLTNFFTLINERQRNNLPYIISTNLSPDEIDARYGNRIKSRIFNTRITLPILFKSAQDLRLYKK